MARPSSPIGQDGLGVLINGKRNMSANTALRLAAFFGTSAQMWMNLQTNYDLWHEERAERKAIKKIKPLKRAA